MARVIIQLLSKNSILIKTLPTVLKKNLKYQTNKGDYVAINQELNSIDWDNNISNLNNDVWSMLSNKLIELRNKFIPVCHIKVQKTSKRPQVLNNSLLHIIREKRWLYKRYKKYRNTSHYQQYCTARARVNIYLRKEKKKETKK